MQYGNLTILTRWWCRHLQVWRCSWQNVLYSVESEIVALLRMYASLKYATMGLAHVLTCSDNSSMPTLYPKKRTTRTTSKNIIIHWPSTYKTLMACATLCSIVVKLKPIYPYTSIWFHREQVNIRFSLCQWGSLGGYRCDILTERKYIKRPAGG